MNNELPAEFLYLRQGVLRAAAHELQQCAPAQVKRFFDTFLAIGDVEASLPNLVGIQRSPQLKRWAELCVDLVDIELQIARVRASLILLGAPSAPPLVQGEWAEYHFDAWTVFTMALLHKTEKFAEDLWRHSMSPHPASRKALESAGLKEVMNLKDRLKSLRDPVAHICGPVEAIAESPVFEGYVLMGSFGNIEMGALGSLTTSRQELRHQHATTFTA